MKNTAKVKKIEKRYHKTHKTTINGISAHINYALYSDATVGLNGYLIESRTGIKKDEDFKSRMVAFCESEVPLIEKRVVARLIKKYEAYHKKPAASVPAGDNLYTAAYDSLSDDQHRLMCPITWKAENTINQCLGYFRNTVLPLLDPYGTDICASDITEILKNLSEKIKANQGPTPLLSEEQVIARHITDFNRLYPKLQGSIPELDLPNVIFPSSVGIRRAQTEQCKALANDVLIRFSALLLRLISNGLAMGGVMMMTGMTRTAEACAPKFGEILFRGNYAVYGVVYQANGKIRVADLKTTSSYRLVILPKYAVDCLNARMDYLRQQGYTDDMIREMYVVTKANDPEVMAASTDLSAFLRKLLSLAGCNNAYWEGAEKLLRQEPDKEHDGIGASLDQAAYVLRRNGCTLCCNVCGMDTGLVDAIMGHRPSRKALTNWNAYLRRPDNWPTIAEKLERAVFHPAHSANPAFLPIDISAGKKIVKTEGQIIYRVRADPSGGNIDLVVKAETLERGDVITLLHPRPAKQILADALTLDSTQGPILGAVHDQSYYKKYLDEADAIDLSNFMVCSAPNTQLTRMPVDFSLPHPNTTKM